MPHIAKPNAEPSASDVKISGMQRGFLLAVLVLTVIPGYRLFATLPSPGLVMEQVVPAEAQPGTVVTATGYALDSEHIEELYLVNDEDAAYQADILSASGTSLRFRISKNTPAGLMRIAVKVPGKAGLIDQMIYLKVLEPAG